MAGNEVLIVVSKLKNYIKQTSGLSTAGTVPEVLTSAIKTLCEDAIENAKKEGRKTVMDRDFKSSCDVAPSTESCGLN